MTSLRHVVTEPQPLRHAEPNYRSNHHQPREFLLIFTVDASLCTMPRPRAPSFEHTPLSLPPDHTLVQLATAQGSGNYLSVDPDGEERLVEVSTKVKRAKVLIVKGEPG